MKTEQGRIMRDDFSRASLEEIAIAARMREAILRRYARETRERAVHPVVPAISYEDDATRFEALARAIGNLLSED